MSRPEQQVELLVGAAELDVGVDRDRVVALQQRVEQLEHRDRLAARRSAWRSRRARAAARRWSCAASAEQVRHRHVEPLAVAADLERGLGVEDLERLLLEGARRWRRSPRRTSTGRVRRAAAGVADARGVVADDQHDRVARRPGTRAACCSTTVWPRWMSGAVGSMPELDAQRPALAAACASLRSSAPSGRESTALRASQAACAAGVGGCVGIHRAQC